MTPRRAADLLADLSVAETLSKALAEQAEGLTREVRSRLSEARGGQHDQPWLETGSLRSSISSVTDGLTAEVGSNDPAAAPQELGTRTTPPRPFLAPAATQTGEMIAAEIGRAMFELIAKRLA